MEEEKREEICKLEQKLQKKHDELQRANLKLIRVQNWIRRIQSAIDDLEWSINYYKTGEW